MELAPLREGEFVSKKNRGREGRLAQALQIEFIAKKNRGREGRLALGLQNRVHHEDDEPDLKTSVIFETKSI